MHNAILLFSLLCTAVMTNGLFAQTLRPAEQVQEITDETGFEESFNLFTPTKSQTPIEVLDQAGVDYDVFELDAAGLTDLRKSAPATLQITLPGSGDRLDLVRANLFADGFRISESGEDTYTKAGHGLHYRGVVAGDKSSVVALSVFEDEVSGMIANAEGNFVLGKLTKSSSHVLYNDKDLPAPDLGECATEDSGIPYSPKELLDLDNLQKDANNCVNVYLEVDNSIYTQRGSNTANVTVFMTGLFNQVATLYANENINLVMSELYIWTSSDPYNSSSSTGNLNAFMNNRSSFNGDIAHLVSFQASGGVAYVDVLCATQFAYGFSSINNSYQSVPSYSWSVNVMAHEIGHNFGSQHTHACVWNGNNTALDACRTTEGGCAATESRPSGGGTIMSYCHLTSVGVNFNKGFGTQPGNLMRNRAYNGSCLSNCSGGGGGGTGGGGNGGGGSGGGNGGGSGCTDAVTTITINTDNYPGETTWTLRNAAGSTLASGGPYATLGATFTQELCLPAGCYDFVINDTYGDGICCAYGNGSFNINVEGTDVVSGGSFRFTTTENFCITDSDDDGGGNGGGDDDGGDDDGGGDTVCDAISFVDYPPVSYGSSQDRGPVTVMNSTTIRLENNAWKAILLNYTVTANTIIEFDFGSTRQGEIHGIGFDNDNRISSNQTFRLYGSQTWGRGDFDTYTNIGTWKSFTIPVGQFYRGDFNRLFFTADHDGGAQNGTSYFRNIRIYEGSSCVALLTEDGQAIEDDTPLNTSPVLENLTLFPNPASDQVNVDLTTTASGPATLRIVDLRGRTLLQQKMELSAGNQRLGVPVGNLPAGAYLLRIDGQQGYQATARFTVAR